MVINNISKSLNRRIISAATLAPLVLATIYFGGFYFNTLIIFMAVIMTSEWFGIINNARNEDDTITKPSNTWVILGILYVGVFASCLLYLRNLEKGFETILFLVLLIWSTDISAYFTGKLVGGPKIFKPISPNKTWSGLIGGMVAASLVGSILSIFTNYNLTTMVILGAAFAVIAQFGDFLESGIKRKFGVKDSGNIIPGHGGIMDRMDGFVTTTPLFVVISVINGGEFFI